MASTLQNQVVRIGVIGCGGFGLFALQQFAQVPGVRLVGMAGTARPSAIAAVRRFGLDDIVDIESLLALPQLDLVYIATPPFLHFQQTKLALEARKHVICEKPLALSVAEADELITLAHQHDRLLIANLMQRYNPLFEIVRQLIHSEALGAILHGYFENYASDENLPGDHWFWDRAKSGGIFIEHGVHFFDLIEGWLGPGEIVSAQASLRPGTELEDQVQCVARYPQNAWFNFYHGFHQPGRLDRQELRLVFERGDVLLAGWVPSYARVHALTDEAGARTLCELFSGCRIDVLATYGAKERRCRGHGNEYDVYQEYELHWGEGTQKLPVYCRLLRDLLSDQIAWIRDRSHQRVVTERNGRDSVAMACAADSLAHAARQ